jgi:uncharacterized membrane protein YgcG
MELAYILAGAAAIVVAVWLQRTTSMARGYAWLSRLGAAVFALLFVPTLARDLAVATVAQAVVLTCLPLIAVPYQVRMMKLIERSKSARPAGGAGASGGARGPGGGRVRPRGRGRR